jgi:hypothetical protein
MSYVTNPDVNWRAPRTNKPRPAEAGQGFGDATLAYACTGCLSGFVAGLMLVRFTTK